MFDYTHSFYRFPEELQNSRLDVLFNDKIFDIVDQAISKASCEFCSLEELALENIANFRKESRDPRNLPDDEFLYVDIGSIDVIRGDSSPETMLGSEATSSRMRRVIKKDDVLVSTTRPTRNAIFVVPDELDEQICSTGFGVIEVNPAHLLPRFLFYALRSQICNLQFEMLCSGSGYPAINQEIDLPKIRIPKPRIDVQKKIIAAIEPIEQKARELERDADRFRDLASDLLLSELAIGPPNHSNYFFKSGTEKHTISFFVFPEDIDDRLHYLYYHPRYEVLNELKEQYELELLGDICEEPIHRGEQPRYYDDGDCVVLKTINLKNGFIDYANALHTSQEYFDSKPTAHVRKNDILVASTGYGSLGKVDIHAEENLVFADGHLSILRLSDQYDPDFVAYYLRSYLGQTQIEKLWTGSSGQIELQPQDLSQLLVPSCKSIPLKKQREISGKIAKKLRNALALDNDAMVMRSEISEVFSRFIFGDAYSF